MSVLQGVAEGARSDNITDRYELASGRAQVGVTAEAGDTFVDVAGSARVGTRAARETASDATGGPTQAEGPDADVEAGHGGFHELHRAVLHGRVELVRRLVAAGASVNVPIMHGGQFITLLHLLGSRPDLPNGVEMLAVVLGARANLNSRSSFGSTPLARACFHKHVQAASILLEAGADTRPADDRGLTALHCAVSLEAARGSDSASALPASSLGVGAVGPARSAGVLEVEVAEAASGELVSLLVARGADLEVSGQGGASALLEAVHGRNRAGVGSLLRAGARPSCLHAAVGRAPVGIIEDLLAGHANPLAQDNEGKMVLDIAFSRGDEEVITLLRDCIGELERKNVTGNSSSPDTDPDVIRGALHPPGGPPFVPTSSDWTLQSVHTSTFAASGNQSRPVGQEEPEDDEPTLGLSMAGLNQRGISNGEGSENVNRRWSFTRTRRWSFAHPVLPRRLRLLQQQDEAANSEAAGGILWGCMRQILVKLQPSCQKLNRSQNFQLLTLAALIAILFLPDFWIIFDVHTNTGLDWILVVVFALFTVELLVQTVAAPKMYFNSFFFWMDVVGLLSVPLDHSLVSDSLPPSLDNTVVARAARTARLGARAGRFMKLVKLLRFLPGVQHGPNQGGPNPGTARSVSNAVMTSLSTRVSCLIIVMVMVLPLFEMVTYPENDNSMKAWVNSLDFTLGRHGGDEMVSRLLAFESFYIDKDYYPFEVSWESGGNLTSARLNGNKPRRRQNEMTIEASSGAVQVLFNFGPQNRIDALCNVVLVVVVIMLMMGFSLLLSNSVSEIVLAPLDNLLRGVKGMASKIFRSVNSLAATASAGEGAATAAPQTGAGDKNNFSSETELLEKVIDKLAALSAITMKAPPADSATLELLGEADRSAAYQGSNEQLGKMQSDPSARRSESSYASASLSEAGGDDHTEELVLEIERLLEEAGLVWAVVDSWEFDALEVSEAQRLSACLSFLIFHLGLSYQKRQEGQFFTFLEVACNTYMHPSKVPYHNFCHAADVSHCVFRLLMICGAEHILSNCERFALMVSAVGHDLGHPGFNNPFLVETAHDLAIRYNDHSPLENMHCAKLFEIAGRPEASVFGGLDRQQYREARQVCVEAILHTDNVHHFTMIKEMQMLYEMSSDVFDVSLQIHQSMPIEFPPREWIDILSEPDKKKMLRNAILHFSDISNPTKPFPVCKKWAWLIMDEFLQQGDREKELGITVQPLNDRSKVSRPYAQVGFIEFFVAPFAFASARLLPPLVPCTDQMMLNLGRWCEEWSTTTVPAPDEAERTKLQERVARLEAKFVFRDGF